MLHVTTICSIEKNVLGSETLLACYYRFLPWETGGAVRATQKSVDGVMKIISLLLRFAVPILPVENRL